MTYRFSSSSKEALAGRARAPVAMPIPPGLGGGRDYRVILPDQRGCGRSSRISGRGIARIGQPPRSRRKRISRQADLLNACSPAPSSATSSIYASRNLVEDLGPRWGKATAFYNPKLLVAVPRRDSAELCMRRRPSRSWHRRRGLRPHLPAHAGQNRNVLSPLPRRHRTRRRRRRCP